MNYYKQGTYAHFISEPAKKIPVAYDVDVAVVGGGVSGLFAALSCANEGAKTVLIDRFGSIGGNMGPGFLIGGGADIDKKAKDHIFGGLKGLPKKFFEELNKIRVGNRSNYAEISNSVSYMASRKAKEYGIELILSSFAADPIVKGNSVKGLFIEGKSGRMAVKAKIVIDSTGDAEIAARAGAAVINNVSDDYKAYGNIYSGNVKGFNIYNESGVYFFIAGVDFEKYRKHISKDIILSDKDIIWKEKCYTGRKLAGFPDALIPALRKAWESGEYNAVKELGDPDVTITSYGKMKYCDEDGLVGTRGAIAAGSFNNADVKHISIIETALRVHAFETVQFLKSYVPGFEKAHILFISPFVGARGGRCILGEHTLTVKEAANGARFDDAIYRNIKRRPGICTDWTTSGVDVPYRILLPKRLDGLLVTGRGASYMRRGHDGAGLRIRSGMMMMGQAAGIAAALAVRNNKSSQKIESETLKQELIKKSIFIEEFHLKER